MPVAYSVFPPRGRVNSLPDIAGFDIPSEHRSKGIVMMQLPAGLENKDVVRSIYTSINQGDTTSAMHLFHPDVVLHEASSLPFGGTYQGLEAVGRAIAQVMTVLDLTNLHVAEVVAEGEHVIAFLKIPIVGKNATISLVECWRLRNGKIIEITPYYWDTNQLTA